MLPCFMLPYIYYLRISEASSFRRKKINMCNKLVMLRLVQIKQIYSFINVQKEKLHKIHFHVADNKNRFSQITSFYKWLHIPLFLDIFQFNKTLLTCSFLLLFCFSVCRQIEKFWLAQKTITFTTLVKQINLNGSFLL